MEALAFKLLLIPHQCQDQRERRVGIEKGERTKGHERWMIIVDPQHLRSSMFLVNMTFEI